MPLFQPERVAVIGGGCTGVTSFWALQSSSHDVHLFEASAALGGRVKTLPFEHNSNRVDVNTDSPTFNAEASRQCHSPSMYPSELIFSLSQPGFIVTLPWDYHRQNSVDLRGHGWGQQLPVVW